MLMVTKNSGTDLAGQVQVQATYLSTRARINRLVDRYLAVDVLSDRSRICPVSLRIPINDLGSRSIGSR